MCSFRSFAQYVLDIRKELLILFVFIPSALPHSDHISTMQFSKSYGAHQNKRHYFEMGSSQIWYQKSRSRAAAFAHKCVGYDRFFVDLILINIFTCMEYIPPHFQRQVEEPRRLMLQLSLGSKIDSVKIPMYISSQA